MREFNLHWSFGNTKLGKLRTIGFGIPAYRSESGFKTCPHAGACAALCYARAGMYRMPHVIKLREENLESARRKNFAKLAIEDLSRIGNEIVRIHDSGDFFSQSYLDAWKEIATAHPEKKFYAYTKSLDLDFSDMPKNFTVVQSQGGLLDARINKRRQHSRIFASHDARERAGYVDGNIHDGPAIYGTVKIGLVYHGTKKLTEAQERYFS